MGHLQKQIRDTVVTALTGLSTTDSRVYALAAYALLNANINQIANRIAMKREAAEPKPKPVSPARRIRRAKQQNWVNGWR